MQTSEGTRRGTARRKILDATIQVIARDGVDSVTHRKVAELAGVSPGSTTHHFESREALLRAACRHYYGYGDTMMTLIDDSVRHSVEDPVERIVEFLCELVRREFDNERFVRAEYELILLASGDAELAADLRAWESRWVGYLAGHLESAGWSRPIERARMLVNLVRGFELERLVTPDLGADALRSRLNLALGNTAT